MEKLVQANSFPYMQGGFSNATAEGERVLSLDLLNRGVGPANQRSLRVRVGDRYVTSMSDLIEVVLGPEQAREAIPSLDPMKNAVRRRFIPGGEQQFVFRMTRRPENAQYWDRLNASWPTWNIEYCYCSVFQDCWRVDGIFEEPAPVKECRRDEAHEFTP